MQKHQQYTHEYSNFALQHLHARHAYARHPTGARVPRDTALSDSGAGVACAGPRATRRGPAAQGPPWPGQVKPPMDVTSVWPLR